MLVPPEHPSLNFCGVYVLAAAAACSTGDSFSATAQWRAWRQRHLHEQCMLGTGLGPRMKINIVADLNFSFSSSKEDFLDAANRDRLVGSLITTYKT